MTVETRAQGRSARELLTWSRRMIDPALHTAVDRLPTSMRRVAGYHFGWWDEQGRPGNGQAGKAFRPTLVLLTTEAVGGNALDAVPAAVAVELAHNFSLLHDDVLDGDLTRRHRPTAWSVFGVSEAILAGDALLTLAFDVLAGCGHRASGSAIRALSAAVLEQVNGQSANVAFEERTDVGLSECVYMAASKTAALMGCAATLGALFGDAGVKQIERLRDFGEHLGVAFQFVDDVLGIWGDPAVTGKPVHSDLSNRKKTLPVVAALTSGTPAGRELAALYHGTQPLSDLDLARAAGLIDAAGGRAWAEARAEHRLAHALSHLESARPLPVSAAELSSLARLVVRRDH